MDTTKLNSPLDVPGSAPEYLRPANAAAHFDLSRSKIYELMRAGKIASVSLREEGQAKATRLVHIGSLRRFLEARLEGGEAKQNSPPNETQH